MPQQWGETLARKIKPNKLSITIGHADLTAAATSQAINIGSPLPPDAVILGREIRLATAFSGGTVSACTVSIGGTSATAIVNAESIFTGATTAKKGTDGANPFGRLGGQQLTATITTTGDNVVNLSAGSMTIDIYYFIDIDA